MRLPGQEPLRRGKSIRGRQDSRAVHDSRVSDGKNAPWRQDARAVHSPTALCGAFRMHGAHILPKLAVFEYMQAICCHEPVLFPSEAPSGTHRGDILPWPAAWGCIRAQSCHGRQLGNASGRYLAMARRRMIAAEVHRRPISDCNGAPSGAPLYGSEGALGGAPPLRLREKPGSARLCSAEKNFRKQSQYPML